MNTIYPWQQTQWHHMLAYLRNNRLPHGLLLAGPKDLGKLVFAQMFAKYILCQNRSECCCETCVACLLMTSKNHPDFMQIQPEAAGKVICVEQIRAVVAILSQTAQQSGWRVVIIEPAEMMNTAATNALLKTLEEPPPQVLFLLVSHQPGALLATLRSRCQSIAFPVPEQAMAAAWLKEQLPAHLQSKIPQLLTFAEAAPLRALALSDQTQCTARETVLEHFIDLSTGRIDPVEMAASCLDVDFSIVFNTLWSFIMDLLWLKASLDNSQMLRNLHQLQALASISHKVSYEKIVEFLERFIEAFRHIQDKINLNIQLFFEGIFIHWISIQGK